MALRDNMISYWNLDEASGTRIDSHGSQDLTDKNTVQQASGGGPGGQNCARFELANDETLWADDSADNSFGDEDFTVAGWVFFVTFTGGNDVFLSKREEGDAQWQMLYKDSAAEDEMWHILQSSSGSGEVPVKDTGGFSTGTWYFCVGTYDAAANEIALTINDGTTFTTSHSGGSWDGGGRLVFGGFVDGGTTADADVRMAMWGLWRRKITSSEITQLYNSGSGLTYSQTGFTPRTIIY